MSKFKKGEVVYIKRRSGIGYEEGYIVKRVVKYVIRLDNDKEYLVDENEIQTEERYVGKKKKDGL